MERRYGFAAKTNWALNRSNGSNRSNSLRISPSSERARAATTRITNSTVTACRSDVSRLRRRQMKSRADLVWATLGEGGLVLALATIGLITNQPLIFASLGPTAYELVEQPQMPSARPYNVIVGHLLGM